MTTLIEVRDALKSYGSQTLLDETGVTLSDQYKVGFVGRNGAGKSTLCRVILGDEVLDSGEVTRHPQLRLGYLRQHDPFQKGETALDFLMRDSGQPDWKCGAVAGRFELKGRLLEGPISELSGGWQTRVKLAALLLHDPNLLLLDEPTNFLDLRTQLLLEHFLREFRGGCLIVSHDRAFLKATCTHTLELSRGRLTMFSGDIDAYLENVRERIEHDERVNAATLAKRRQLETFIEKNRANANTASQARSKAKQLERLKMSQIDAPEATVDIRVPQVEARKGIALRCTDLAIGYGDRKVADGINVEIEHGSRVAVVGDNGQGKTTFLRSVVNSLPPLSGSLRWGHGCDLGVYAQHVYTTLPQDRTVYQYLEDQALPGTTMQSILAVAGSLLFRDDHIHKPIPVLSGGERARLCMAGLLLGRHTVLVLDEPGNHLDVETVEALAEALIDYDGTVVFTSHDRHFMRRVATCVLEVRDGGVTNYPGSYEDYLYRVSKEIDDGERIRQEASAAARPAKGDKAPAKGGGQKSKDPRKEMATIERKIARLDDQKKELQQQFLTCSEPAAAEKLHAELATVTDELAAMEERWCELQEQFEGAW